MPSRRNKAIAGVVLILAFVLRAGVLWSQRENLEADPDAYRAVAEALLDGQGFCNSVTGNPTAFRPPLYPLLIALGLSTGAGTLSVALLHLVAGTATVWLTLRMGRQLELGNTAVIAALLVAVDPLLLQYTTYVMTETVFTFLLTALLAAATCRNVDGHRHSLDANLCASPAQSRTANTDARNDWVRQILVGSLFGLCALCRPTIWPVGLLAAAWWACRLLGSRERGRRWRAIPWLMLFSIAFVVSPWLIRNLIVFGKPIYTTTHGGYTLLLGNNPVYYRQEVDQPFGTVWEDAPPGQTQQDWRRDLRTRMAADLGKNAPEPEQDRWMYREAFQTIEDEPQTFLRACLLRFVKFWNVIPLGSARAQFPDFVVWAVAGFYLVEFVGFAFGLTRISRRKWANWMPLLIAIVGFTLVHLVFWTNARMRAPLIPAIALFFAAGVKPLIEAWSRRRPGKTTAGATDVNP